MYQEQNPTEATRLILWEEHELYVLAVAHAVKVRRQLKEGDEVLHQDRGLARIYVDREQHLHEVAEVPETVVEGMVVTLRDLAERSEEEAREIARSISDTDYTSLLDIERLRIGDLAEEMAKQLESPEYAEEVQVLEGQFRLPVVEEPISLSELPEETGRMLELPAPSAEADEAA